MVVDFIRHLAGVQRRDDYAAVFATTHYQLIVQGARYRQNGRDMFAARAKI